LTTAQRLRTAAAGRKRLRWRALVRELLADVVDGVQSTLERRYRNDVERPHGLPRGQRNQADGTRGRRRYRDVRYARWKVVIELDGRAAHPEEWRERDDLRDNELADREGARTLRYGWTSVAARPCATAAQVGRVLVAGGWTGAVTACGPGCTAVSAGSDAP
jgi:very-short-patch-repair endonuclease